jgi:hypothetical protein
MATPALEGKHLFFSQSLSDMSFFPVHEQRFYQLMALMLVAWNLIACESIREAHGLGLCVCVHTHTCTHIYFWVLLRTKLKSPCKWKRGEQGSKDG